MVLLAVKSPNTHCCFHGTVFVHVHVCVFTTFTSHLETYLCHYLLSFLLLSPHLCQPCFLLLSTTPSSFPLPLPPSLPPLIFLPSSSLIRLYILHCRTPSLPFLFPLPLTPFLHAFPPLLISSPSLPSSTPAGQDGQIGSRPGQDRSARHAPHHREPVARLQRPPSSRHAPSPTDRALQPVLHVPRRRAHKDV